MNNRKAKILLARTSVKVRVVNISNTRYAYFYSTPWGTFIQGDAMLRKGRLQVARATLQREGW